MACPSLHLLDEPIDYPFQEVPNSTRDIDSMSSGYTPDPSPLRNEVLVEVPEMSQHEVSSQNTKGKEKFPEDSGREKVPESDTHFGQMDKYLECNLSNATSVKLIGDMLEDFNFPDIHSVMVPTQRQRIYYRPAYKEAVCGVETSTSWVGISH